MSIKSLEKVKKLFYLLILSLLSSLSAFAQDGLPIPGEKIVVWENSVFPEVSRKGEQIRLTFHAQIKEGWHIYSLQKQDQDAPPPTKIYIKTTAYEDIGPPYETRPIFKFDKVIGLSLQYHENEAAFYQNLEIPLQDNQKADSETIVINITYQACSNRVCLPPEKEEFLVEHVIESGSARDEYKIASRTIDEFSQSTKENSLGEFNIRSVLAFAGFAALMGILSIITPCVFPMIPITVSYFIKKSVDEHTNLWKLSAVFISGIILFFTTLGFISALFFGASSFYQFSSHYLTNFFIGLLFVFFGLSLIGIFEIRLPSGVVNFVDQQSRKRKGYFSVLLMGIAFTLTAFTCNVQFVGTLLVAASQGEKFWPILGLLVYSSAFSLPFLILSVSPKLIPSLRGKSGPWLSTFKFIIGVVEILIALKFFANVDLLLNFHLLTRDAVIVLWLLGLAVIFVAVVSIREFFAEVKKNLIISLILVSLGGYLSAGIGGYSLGGLWDSILPPAEDGILKSGTTVSEEEFQQLNWNDSYHDVMAISLKENKNVFIDFTGYSCVNCRWMEQNIFPEKEVFQYLKEDYLLARLYTDGGNGALENQNLQIEKFNTIALPFYVILDPNKNEIVRYSGTSYQKEDFIKFLKEGLKK